MKLKNILSEQILCHLIAPKGKGKGGYMDNKEALVLIEKIKNEGDSEIKDPKKLEEFNDTIEKFKDNIIKVDTNLDTIDTYLHKLRDIVGCFNLD